MCRSDKEVLVELYVDRRLSLEEVAAQLDLSAATLRRKLIAYGIPTRTRGSRPGQTDRYQRPADVLTRRLPVETYQRRGMTIARIAEQTGFSYDTVQRFLRQDGIPIRPGRFTVRYHVDRRQLARLRRQGLTLAEIAERLGSSRSTVERALRRHGIGRG
jgi:transposase